MLCERAAREELVFFAPICDLASILVTSARSRALLGAQFGVPGRHWGRSGRSQGVPGTPRDAPETLPRHPWDAPGRHGASQACPRTDFDSILGAPEALSGLILNRFSRRFCQLAWLAEFQAKCTASIKMHRIARISSKFEQIGSNLLAVRSILLGIRANFFEISSHSLDI